MLNTAAGNTRLCKKDIAGNYLKIQTAGGRRLFLIHLPVLKRLVTNPCLQGHIVVVHTVNCNFISLYFGMTKGYVHFIGFSFFQFLRRFVWVTPLPKKDIFILFFSLARRSSTVCKCQVNNKLSPLAFTI